MSLQPRQLPCSPTTGREIEPNNSATDPPKFWIGTVMLAGFIGLLAEVMGLSGFASAQNASSTSPDPRAPGSRTATFWIVDVAPGTLNLASTTDGRSAEPSSSKPESWRWFSPAIRQRKLVVDVFDSKRLAGTAGTASDPIQVRSDQVVWAKPEQYSEAERLGLEQLAEGETGAALRNLLKALESRPPVWRQQFLSMAAAQCAARSGRGAITIELLRQLDQRPLPPLVLGWLPIEWRRGVVPVSAKRESEQAEATTSPMVELVRASWAFELNREDSLRKLDQLAEQKSRPMMATLATILRFRAANPIEAKERWRKVRSQIESLPISLQTGPMVMLAGKLMAIGEKEHAERLVTSLEIVPLCPHPDVPASLQPWKK